MHLMIIELSKRLFISSGSSIGFSNGLYSSWLKVQIILSFIIAFAWMSFIVNNSANMPIMDDYDSILEFLISFKNSDSISRLRLMFSTHNEHPLLFSNIVVLFSSLSFGQINFIYLIVLANAIVFIFFMALVNEVAQENIDPPILAFSLLFFNLCAGTVLIWPMAALQHFSSVTLAFFTIKYFCQNRGGGGKNNLRYPLLYLASFSGGANIFILPVVFLCIFGKRDLKEVVRFSLNSLMIVGIFLYFRSKGGEQVDFDFVEMIKFFFLFLGNPLGSKWAYFLGIFVVVAVSVAWYFGFNRKFPVFFYYSIFIFFVAMAAAISRSTFGSGYALESKYTIYSLSCLASIAGMYVVGFGVCFKNFRMLRLWYLFIYIVSFYVFFNAWIFNRSAIIDLARISWIIHPSQEVAGQILIKAQQAGIYSGQRYIVNFPKSQ
jgi:hypothetical protein